MASVRPPIKTASDLKELLLYYKAQRPINSEQKAELERISKLDVTNYSEADVRAEIIDPVVRILGYSKGSYFSIHREKHLKIADSNLFIDYQMTLWSQSFWIIEAKKVKRKAVKFTSKDLKQALLYAAHPEIDAALVVLCDGRVFEIYDRDESVSDPIVRVEVQKLPEQFHELQAFLSPWQAWFFQKRRVLKLASRVLLLEMIPGRIEEFSDAIQRRIQKARTQVYVNWRKLNTSSNNLAQWRKALETSSVRDIIRTEFFSIPTDASLVSVANALVSKAKPGAFELILEMLPNPPKPLNDNYIAYALRTLVALDDSGYEISMLPSWLSVQLSAPTLKNLIKKLIFLSLSAFQASPEYRTVLQYSACAHRLSKILMARLPDMTYLGEVKHQLTRYLFDELDDIQYFSTPTGHNLQQINVITYQLTERFVDHCGSSLDFSNRFNLSRARTLLRDAWNSEVQLLSDGFNYWLNLKGRDLNGEGYSTESNWVTFDSLGHIVVCVLRKHSYWKDYLLKNHTKELRRLASCSSWAAREILGADATRNLMQLTDAENAKWFFDGDVQLFTKLRTAYEHSKC